MVSIIFFHFVVATIVKHEASDWWHGVWKTTKATKGYGESSLICWQWWASYASNEQPWKDKNLIRLAINLAVLKHYKSILWEIRKCPFCGTERSINADCKYECQECGTCYWQSDGNTPRLIGCPDCREGQERINADATDQNGMTAISIYCWLLNLAQKLLLSEWIWVKKNLYKRETILELVV